MSSAEMQEQASEKHVESTTNSIENPLPRDNYNNVVRSIRQQPQLLAPTSEIANANAEASLKANVPEEGAVLKGKIKGVKVYKSADKKSQILYTLKKNEEVVFLGDHSAGYYFIVGEDGEGWVRSSLVK